uniref:Translation initiation factor eIF2B subunit delta n=1 Tax=Schistocephalus solidus TaxID=70667 RepID=A0A0X3PBB9_SCHSO
MFGTICPILVVLQVSSNAASRNTPTKQKVQQTGQQKHVVQPSESPIAMGSLTVVLDPREPLSTSAVITTATTKSKTAGHALGVMRMDDPVHLKKSIKQLHKKNLHPRQQEPVRVNLFSHLSQPDKRVDVLGELSLGQQASIHPAFISLGIDIDEGRIWGSNRRCLEFLRATVALINSYAWNEHAGDVPATGSLSRSFVTVLVRHVTFLDQCRPLPVTVRNAVQFLKQVLNRLDSVTSAEEVRASLLEEIDLFVKDRIRLAGKAIAALALDSIRPGECVCTYGYSSLVAKVLIRAWRGEDSTNEANTARRNHSDSTVLNGRLFSVLVVDSRPCFHGREMFFNLRKAGIPCELTHIAALPMIAKKVSLTILGAHSLLNNGHVIARVGTAQVANIVSAVAHTPVLVCAETYKFWERAQSDAFEFNELSDPDDIWRGPRGIQAEWDKGLPDYYVSPPSDVIQLDGDESETYLGHCFQSQSSLITPQRLSGWRIKKTLRLLNLTYDVLPPELVTAVVTELGILPTTSVPVVLRVTQSAPDAEVIN